METEHDENDPPERHPIAADSSSTPDSPQFTSQFFLLCDFTFTTFISAFLLFPTMPFRILSLGGSKSEAGLFLGFITSASAFSAPLGARWRTALERSRLCYLSAPLFSGLALSMRRPPQLWLILLAAVVHGVFWSALLGLFCRDDDLSSGMPDAPKALASTVAIATASAAGFWLLQRGWGWLCFCMGSLAAGMSDCAPTSGKVCPPNRRVGRTIEEKRYESTNSK